VVEIGTLTKPVLYLQYLVRLESAGFSVCTLQTVWGLSRDIARDDASQAELVGLDYTLREAEKYEQIFLISDQVKLRAYLEANLSRAVEKCDETDGHWEVCKRVTPELSPTPDEPNEDPGNESSSAPPQR
jgi:hypothetical protein